MTSNHISQRWAEIDRELEELWAGKVSDGDPATREAELLAEQDRLEFEAGEEWFLERNLQRRSVKLIASNAFEITTLDEWFKHAPPKKKEIHWQEFRSAMECARAWLRDGHRMPTELLALLDSQPETRGFFYDRAYPEHVIRLDSCVGEHRNSDVTVHGRRGTRRMLIDVEAKADEEFGSSTIAQQLKKGMSIPRSGIPGRIAALSQAVFGRGVDDAIGRLRYQLLYSFAAPVIEAGRSGASIAALIVHEFHSVGLSTRKLTANAKALQDFVSAVPGWEGERIEPGVVLPPITLHRSDCVRNDIPVTIGKIRTNVS